MLFLSPSFYFQKKGYGTDENRLNLVPGLVKREREKMVAPHTKWIDCARQSSQTLRTTHPLTAGAQDLIY